LTRGDFRKPLVVGDRLDTDIAGANAAGLPSLMVLTGVNTAADAVFAVDDHRPTYLGEDLRALSVDADALRIGAHPAWRTEVAPDAVTVTATGIDPIADDLSVVRATARAVWDAKRSTVPPAIRAGDDTARAALDRWALLTPDRLA